MGRGETDFWRRSPGRTNGTEAGRWMSDVQFPIGKRISLPGHFAEPVLLESVRRLGAGCECRVRLTDGTLDERVLSPEETTSLDGQGSVRDGCRLVDPRRLDDYLDQIDRINPDKLREYEVATGIALARGHVDFSGFQQRNLEIEERRLMPKYVEDQFVAASKRVGLRVEPRADGLRRVEHAVKHREIIRRYEIPVEAIDQCQ